MRSNDWKLDWKRILAGLMAGAANFATFFLAMAFGLRNGLGGPSYWYDMPVVLALIFLPCLAWTAYLIRAGVRSRGIGRPLAAKVLHGIVYWSSQPAGFAMAFLAFRSL